MWISFIALGLSVAAIWATLTRRQLGVGWRLGGVLCLVLLALMLFVLFVPRGLFLGGVWYQETPTKEAIAFLLMLSGMSARYFTKAIEERRQKALAAPNKKHRIRLDPWEFSYPLFTSVITFGVLLQQLGSEELTLANLVLAFQTGFFWQTILVRTENAPIPEAAHQEAHR